MRKPNAFEMNVLISEWERWAHRNFIMEMFALPPIYAGLKV